MAKRAPKKRRTKPRDVSREAAALAALSSHLTDSGEDAGARPPPLFNWLKTRSAGVLLHPTSLPGTQGCGTFDENVIGFLDFLKAAGFKSWQICPLGPTGFGDSPYQCFSAFAGNPYLIDLTILVHFGLLSSDEIAPLAKLARPDAAIITNIGIAQNGFPAGGVVAFNGTSTAAQSQTTADGPSWDALHTFNCDSLSTIP